MLRDDWIHYRNVCDICASYVIIDKAAEHIANRDDTVDVHMNLLFLFARESPDRGIPFSSGPRLRVNPLFGGYTRILTNCRS